MASFRPYPQGSAKNFSDNGPRPQPSDTLDAKRDYLSPHLTIGVKEEQNIMLDDNTPVLPRIPGTFGLPISPYIVLSTKQEFASVEPTFSELGFTRIFKVTGKSEGETRIEARRFDSFVVASLADLIVTVIDKNKVVPNSDIIGGFIDGIAGFGSESVKTVKSKLVAACMIPGGEFLLAQEFQMGVGEGVLQGLKSLADLLKGVANFAFDSAFRAEIERKAAELMGSGVKLIEPYMEMLMTVQGNPQKLIAPLMTNGKAIGKVLGEEIGKEINEEVKKKSARDICRWIGRLVGFVVLEVILQAVTDVLGMAAAQVARWAGEGAAIVARLLPKLKRLLEPLFKVIEELKNALKARLALLGGRKAAELVKALGEYVNLNGKADRAEVELGRWLDQLAQRGQLGVIKRLRGMPEVPGAGSPDYHLFLRDIENAELAKPHLPADLRGDAVIANGNKIDNIIFNAIGDKAKIQADVIFIEIGSRGSSAEISDAAVQAWKVEHVAPMSPSLRRLTVIRNSGGARRIVLDLLIR
jgi:hypothetical protein